MTKKKLRIFDVDFDLVQPTNGGLIILAESKEEALKLALDTVKHKQDEPITLDNITELNSNEIRVLFYADGDY